MKRIGDGRARGMTSAAGSWVLVLAGCAPVRSVLERVTLAVPATVSFQPAFLLLVPGTIGLVALASFDAQALVSAPMMFLSLCIGTKVGSLLADLARITRSTVFLRWTKPARMGEL